MNLAVLHHNKKMLNEWAEMAAKKDMVPVALICRDAEGNNIDIFANGNDSFDSIYENVKAMAQGMELAKKQQGSHGNLRIEKKG